MIARMSYELGQGTGPLRGVRVVEIAGIGPGPHACMMLADLGADVIRLERPGGGLLSGRAARRADPRPPERGARPQAPRRGRGPCSTWWPAPTCWSRGCGPAPTERLGLGPDECRARNPRAGLRPDDRLGPGRAVGAGRRPRPELHRDHRRAARRSARTPPGRTSRPTCSATSAAGRRTSSSACWPRCSRPAPAAQGQVVDAAIVDGDRHLNAMARDVRLRSGVQPETPRAAACSTAARRTTTSTRPPTASTSRSGRSSRSSTPSCSSSCSASSDVAPDRDDPSRHAELRRAPHRDASGSAPRPSGPRSSTAPTPASRRSSR